MDLHDEFQVQDVIIMWCLPHDDYANSSAVSIVGAVRICLPSLKDFSSKLIFQFLSAVGDLTRDVWQ